MQTGGFLNWKDFTYTCRDAVNEGAKVAQGVIKGATNYINNIAKQRIDQIISHGGKEIDCVLPKVLRGVIEDVYQTPFRLLRNSGKQQLNKLKRKIYIKNTFIFLNYMYTKSKKFHFYFLLVSDTA